MHYCCYFVDSHAKLAAVEVIEADNDVDALIRADILLREKGVAFSGVKVWDRERRVTPQAVDGVVLAERIRRWRLKAEEIRTAAEAFADSSARQHMLSSAETYDILAKCFEMRLKREKQTESDAG